jgi:hypothetical protein
MASAAPARVAADVGGTFTDIAVFDSGTGRLALGKTLTTPDRIVEGIGAGVGKAGSRFGASSLFLHGTTDVSLRAARESYGAVVDPASGRVDRAASARLRAEMRAAGLPKDQPFTGDPSVPRYRPGAVSLAGELHAAELRQATQAAGLDDRCCT